MGRPRTPTATLEARGGFVRHPERARARASEPQDKRPLGECPPNLNDEQALAWAELVDMVPPGVTHRIDRGVMELAARSFASLREPTIEIVLKDGSVITVAKPFDNKAGAVLLRCLVEMGMTPASRSKVKVDGPAGPKSDFDKLM